MPAPALARDQRRIPDLVSLVAAPALAVAFARAVPWLHRRMLRRGGWWRRGSTSGYRHRCAGGHGVGGRVRGRRIKRQRQRDNDQYRQDGQGTQHLPSAAQHPWNQRGKKRVCDCRGQRHVQHLGGWAQRRGDLHPSRGHGRTAVQRGAHLLGAAEPLSRVVGHRAFDHRDQAGIDVGSQPGERRPSALQNGAGQRGHIFLREGAMPGKCL